MLTPQRYRTARRTRRLAAVLACFADGLAGMARPPSLVLGVVIGPAVIEILCVGDSEVVSTIAPAAAAARVQLVVSWVQAGDAALAEALRAGGQVLIGDQPGADARSMALLRRGSPLR